MTNLEHAPLPDCSIAEIALDFPQSIPILNHYELDYPCQGQKLFVELCRQQQIDPRKVWEEILGEMPVPAGNMNHRFNTWNFSLLVDFICQNHHEYVRIATPRLLDLVDRTLLIHGENYPLLHDVNTHFRFLSQELLEHLPTEEEVLFPAIKRMAESTLSRSNDLLVSHVRQLLMTIESEHTNIAQSLRLLRSLTDHYTLDKKITCPTFHLLYKLLEEFDNDLTQHIHLENNILFARFKS